MVQAKFIQARWFTKSDAAPRRVDFIVLHDMEAPENATTAEAVAHDFATRPASNKASCHYCVDSNSIVQCVREQDIAYHAPPNSRSIGIEHAGYARQTRAQWLDTYGVKMLTLSAQLCAELCAKYNLPVVFLTAADLKAGKRGITTHAEVSKAWRQTSHTDPGPSFPLTWYLKTVNAARIPPAAQPVAKPATPPKQPPARPTGKPPKLLFVGGPRRPAWIRYLQYRVHGPITGKMDRKTAAQVRAWKIAHRIRPATGYVGRRMWKKMGIT